MRSDEIRFLDGTYVVVGSAIPLVVLSQHYVDPGVVGSALSVWSGVLAFFAAFPRSDSGYGPVIRRGQAHVSQFSAAVVLLSGLFLAILRLVTCFDRQRLIPSLFGIMLLVGVSYALWSSPRAPSTPTNPIAERWGPTIALTGVAWLLLVTEFATASSQELERDYLAYVLVLAAVTLIYPDRFQAFWERVPSRARLTIFSLAMVSVLIFLLPTQGM